MATIIFPGEISNCLQLIWRRIGGYTYPAYVMMLFVITQPVIADYQTGLDEYQKGNFKTAMYEWNTVIAAPPGKVSPAMYAETNYAIGMLYWLGQGVAQDYVIAADWIQKAAELEHGGAQGKLGYLYTQGITVQQSYETAFYWFSKAARQGDIDGQYNLGIFYLNGWGIEQDKTMAAQYLAAASAQGDEAAETALQGILRQNQNSDGGGVGADDMGDSLNSTEVVDIGKEGPGTSRQAGLGHKEKLETGGDASLGYAPPTGIETQATLLPTSWILDQNPDHYTIQVIGLSSMAALENLVLDYDHLAPLATYTLQRNNKPLYLLVQGRYPDVESARQARDEFPAAIQEPEKVWIRKFKKIQELINP